MSKAENALKMISETAGQAAVLLMSFGKDSIVLHDLIRKARGPVRIIHWREPGQPQRYDFADWMIHDMNLFVIDYPHLESSVVYHEGRFDLERIKPLGDGGGIHLSLELVPGTECIKNLLELPTIQGMGYPWPVTFHGHKSADVDPMYGPVPLTGPTLKVGNTTLYYPLHDWTDADVWDYIEANEIPYNTGAYQDRKPLPDKSLNSNFYAACCNCINPDMEDEVDCPALGGKINNSGKAMLPHYEKVYQFYKSLPANIQREGKE